MVDCNQLKIRKLGGLIMNCIVHNDRPAVGTCVGCGKFICQECNTELHGKNYCKSCVEELLHDNKKKIEKLEERSSSNSQPMVFMNAGGASSSSSSSSSSSGGNNGTLVPIKSKVAAGILGIILGGIGAHKFYLGKPIQGLLYLIFVWTGIPAFIGLIEGIIYLCSSDQVFAQKYGGRYI